jgi:AcrR family transcriptional regulator
MAVVRTARDKLLAAADELFYSDGVHTVGIDRVIAHAGVAKASLYNTFGSKDELVRAYLQHRQQTRQERIRRHLAAHDDPRDKLLAVFDAQAETFALPGYRGCAFQNAAAESPDDGPVAGVCQDIRDWTRTLFTDLSREAGATDPEALAHQLVLLYDGATVSARMDRDKDAAARAKAIAETLIAAATSGV